jgi:hypothetical protein
MSTTPSPAPGHPPGRAREELLRYFAECWPPAQRISAVKATEWSEARDREDDTDERDNGSVAEAPRRLPQQGPGVEFQIVVSTDKTQSVLVAEMSARKWRETHGQLPGTWVIVKENCRSVTAVQLPE